MKKINSKGPGLHHYWYRNIKTLYHYKRLCRFIKHRRRFCVLVLGWGEQKIMDLGDGSK